jgi:hypothetical protein
MIHNLVTYLWSLFGWPARGLWSGNLPIVWKFSKIFHG